MRGKELKIRDKKVRKMTRDGLVEKNLTKGTTQSISRREREVSFRQEGQTDVAIGRRSPRSMQYKEKGKAWGKEQKIHHDQIQATSSSQSVKADSFIKEAAQEEEPLGDSPSMKEATDSSMVPDTHLFKVESILADEIKLRRTVRKRRSLYAQEQKEPAAAPSATGGDQSEDRQEIKEGRNTLRAEKFYFEEVSPIKNEKEWRQDNKHEEYKSETVESIFPDERKPERETSVDVGAQPDSDHKVIPRLRHSHSRRELLQKARMKAKSVKKNGAWQEQRQAASCQQRSAQQGEKQETKKVDSGKQSLAVYSKETAQQESSAKENDCQQGETKETSKHEKKYERAQQRVEAAEKKLEKKKMQREEKPPPNQITKTLPRMATAALALKVHQEVRKAEQDNTGLIAAHKVELAMEHAVKSALYWQKNRLREKPYRQVARAERKLKKANAAAAYQKFLADHPEMQKKALLKWRQKQRIKRQYDAAAREEAKGLGHAANVLSAAGGKVRRMVQQMAAHKTVLWIAALLVLFMTVFGALFSSCSSMLQGIEAALVSTCYVADDKEMEESELLYTELETDLKAEIGRTEEDFPDYDEYLYNIGEMGHNPYELMGYLSAAFDAFRFHEVEAEILRLFSLQYELVREEIIESRTYTDWEGQEQEEEWRVLKTTLLVQPLSGIIADRLRTEDEKNRYGLYMLTCGNRQCYGNPFDFSWPGSVTSPYGYRLHPLSGEKDLHRGIDIGVAEGTEVRAVQDGVVLSAGEAGSYGLCIVIEGEDGYQSKYAHCSTLFVSTGQEVKRGDVVAYVGSTGSSTGPHLHLEVLHNREYLNPYYFVDNGGTGYTSYGGAVTAPEISENAGVPMGEERFAALIAEAEKYLGFPYVWGGSTPETSFDCSGYVSYVLKASGIRDVGRQTAQGLYGLSEPVSREALSPGDLVFFTGTYSTASPVSHVGIYVGNGRMIHAGDPISYTDITGQYWSSHYFCGGRLS